MTRLAEKEPGKYERAAARWHVRFFPLAESPEGLLELETRANNLESSALGGNLVEDARELTQTVLPTIEALVAASSCREPGRRSC
jgi:hypothetical protein